MRIFTCKLGSEPFVAPATYPICILSFCPFTIVILGETIA